MSVILQTATQCWWGEWWYLPAALLLTWLGIVGHELTHAVVMLPVAERVRLVRESDWALLRGDFDVESDILNERWRHRWADMAGIAPLAIGLIVIFVATIFNDLPSTSSIIGLGIWNGWLWYTLLGGLSDYSPTRSRQSAGDSTLASDGGEPRATGLATLLPEEELSILMFTRVIVVPQAPRGNRTRVRRPGLVFVLLRPVQVGVAGWVNLHELQAPEHREDALNAVHRTVVGLRDVSGQRLATHATGLMLVFAVDWVAVAVLNRDEAPNIWPTVWVKRNDLERAAESGVVHLALVDVLEDRFLTRVRQFIVIVLCVGRGDGFRHCDMCA